MLPRQIPGDPKEQQHFGVVRAFFQCFGERRQRKLGLACFQKRLGQSDLGCLSVTRTNKRCIVADDCFINCTHLEQHVSGKAALRTVVKEELDRFKLRLR